jgi:hypothetical protein
MTQILKNEKQVEQEPLLGVSQTKQSEFDEDTVARDDISNMSGKPGKIWPRSQHTCNSCGIPPFTEVSVN